jgi:hypothetical protein
MFRVDEGGNTSEFLDLSDNMLREGGFTTGFRAVDFNDSSAWDSLYSESNIQ